MIFLGEEFDADGSAELEGEVDGAEGVDAPVAELAGAEVEELCQL